MNNLKRVLSLGLAGTMLAGMMMVGAGAADVKDFTDSDEIKNQEAVTTMVALGVITGKDTGAYDPAATVTRAEMAKMICIMLNGGKEPVLSTNPTPAYSDIGGHWAQKYIEYCSKNNIIAGQGDGTFAPDATVTGSQAAKMALVALGYDSKVFNFTGVDWEVNVNSTANSPDADLYDTLSGLDPSQPLSRDNAAQLLYNALSARTMDTSYDSMTSSGEVTLKYALGKSTMMEKKFNAVKVEGIVIANEAADLASKADKGGSLDANRTRIQVTNYGTGNGEQDDFNNTLTLQAATGLNDLGRSVNVYVKQNSSNTKAEILGTVIISTDNTVVTDYSGDSIDKVADDNGMKVVSETRTAANYGGSTALTSAAAGKAGTRGVEKVLIDNNDDGEVDYVLLNTYAFGKVTSYVTSGDGSITVSAGKAMTASDKDDVIGFDDVKKDDYVLAAYIGGNLYVEKAESVTGELKSYKTAKDESVTPNVDRSAKLEVEDTNYNVSWVDGYTGGTDDITAATAYGKNNLDTEATFYLGKGEYIAAVGAVVENSYNYALVLGVGTSIDDQVKVALSDGTVGTYTVNTNGDTWHKDNTNTTTSDDHFGIGSVCSYSIGSNGKIKLTEVTSTGLADAKFTKGKTALGDKTAVKGYTNSNTAFFYVDDIPKNEQGNAIDSKKVNTYTGYSVAPSLDSGKTVTGKYITNAAGRIVAVLFVGEDITKTNVDDNMYIYGVNNTSSNFTSVKAFVAGSADPITDLKVDGNDVVPGVYTYNINSDQYYETDPVKLYDGTENNLLKDVTVVASNNKTFVIKTADNKQYELKFNASTLLVDNSKYLDDPTAEMGGRPEEGDKLAYILFDLDSSTPDTAKLVVVQNPKSGTPETPVTPDADSGFTGTNVAVLNKDGSMELRYHGAMPSGRPLNDLIKAADPTNIKTVNATGYNGADKKTVSITDNDGSVYDVTVNAVEFVKVTLTGVTAKIGTENVASGSYVKVGDSLALTSTATTADLQIEVNGAADGEKADGTKAATHSVTAATGTDLVITAKVQA